MATKKTPAKKATATPAPKPAPAKKAVKKTVAKKTSAKETPVVKPPVKKAVAKKAPAKKDPKKPVATVEAKEAVKAARKPAHQPPTREEIACEAFFVYERRMAAGLPGDPHGDWLEAEQILRSRH